MGLASASSKPPTKGARGGQAGGEAKASAEIARLAVPNDGIAAQNRALLALLKLEEDLRAAADEKQLLFLFANEARQFTHARQFFVFRRDRKLRMAAVSGLSAVDRSAPLVSALERTAEGIDTKGADAKLRDVDLHAAGEDEQNPLAQYPYANAIWLPFRLKDGTSLGGMLLTSDVVFADAARTSALRLASAFTQALGMMLSEPRLARKLRRTIVRNRTLIAGTIVAIAAVLAIPVNMSTVAPMEIVPREPVVVAAPIEGAIKQVLVEPGQTVRQGDTVVQFADTVLRNKLTVAEREVRVARARLEKAGQMAFDDAKGRQEIGIAMADLELKSAQKKFAHDVLDRATIAAPRSGIALFADRTELIGKPVSVGERIMQIADPGKVEIEVLVPVSDAIILTPGARVKVFLDSDPINPRTATVEIADYKSRLHDGTTRSFRMIARFDDKGGIPRLGGRGTAQLFGEEVPLAFYLFRRPLSAVRQWLGW